MGAGRVCWAWLALVAVGMWGGAASGIPTRPSRGNRLLYILLDGFRWDYLSKQDPAGLPGFTKLLEEGGRAKWSDPLFPSISYPTWTSLSTGLYAETHGIVGNYFYDPNTQDIFSLFDAESTGKQKWWTSEPIWITAEKAGLRSAQYLWSRCDVPYDGVLTHYCKPFIKIPGKEIFQENIEKALEKLDEGYNFVQVYTEHVDTTGHNFGPDSQEVKQAVRDVDDVLMFLMTELKNRDLQHEVNIVIVSDHGMTTTAPNDILRHELDKYLNASLVENIADKGAFLNLKVPPKNIEEVFSQVSSIPGVTAYRHKDIPESFHFKDHPYIHDIILLADQGNFVMASTSGQQLPPRDDSFVYQGAHGYHFDNSDMKGIFFARGPDFDCGWEVEPIHVVDVYQVLTHVLNILPQPHNGTWSHVENIFNPEDSPCFGNAACTLHYSPFLVLPLIARLANII